MVSFALARTLKKKKKVQNEIKVGSKKKKR